MEHKKKSKEPTYPCGQCFHLDGDDVGLACPNQPEGLPFVERKFFCKYFLQNHCRICGESIAAGKIHCDGCIKNRKNAIQ